MKFSVSRKKFLYLSIIVVIVFTITSSSIVMYAVSTHDTEHLFDNSITSNGSESYATDACSGLRINVVKGSITVEAPKDSCIILNDIIINNFSTKISYPTCVSSLKIGSGGVPLYGLGPGDVVELNITIVYGASRSCTRLYRVSIGVDSDISKTARENTGNNHQTTQRKSEGGSGTHSAGLNSLTKGRPFRGSSSGVVTATLPYAVADSVVIASIALAGVLVGCGVLRRRSPP